MGDRKRKRFSGSADTDNRKDKKKKKMMISKDKKKKKMISKDKKKKKMMMIRKDKKNTSKMTRTRTRMSKPLRVIEFNGELKDMRKLTTNDEAFCLTTEGVAKIISFIRSRKTPPRETYMHWRENVISFYLKMCTCFGVDYQNLEAAADDHNDVDKEQETHDVVVCAQPSTSEMPYDNKEKNMVCNGTNRPSTEELPDVKFIEKEDVAWRGTYTPSSEKMSEEEYLKLDYETPMDSSLCICGPFNFGSYYPEAKPDRVPYHLYLLLKEAVDIMKTTDSPSALSTVEQKIVFFCKYLHCHLPDGCNYRGTNASSLIAGYDPTRKPRYRMNGYVPIGDRLPLFGIDLGIHLWPEAMARVMTIIYSRKTPSFWKMCPEEISFYCKLCSCFGIDYHRLEAASEEDVCLMRVA